MGPRATIRTAAVAATMIAMAVATPAAAEQQSRSSQLAAKVDFPEMKHVQSGLCLDGSLKLGVRLNKCHGGDHQRWYKESRRNGVMIVHLQSRLCLDGSTTKGVRLLECHGGVHQGWYTYDSGSIPNLQSGLCLDGSTKLGVRLNKCHGGTHQQWS
ncbi:hypothetical protein GCM10018965_043950 [Nonomuraea roseola]